MLEVGNIKIYQNISPEKLTFRLRAQRRFALR